MTDSAMVGRRETAPYGWRKAPIAAVLAQQFAGEWGSEARPGGANVGVLRSTNLEEGGKLNYTRAAWRFVDPDKVQQKRLIEGDILLEGSGGGPGTPVGRVAYFTDPDSHDYVCSNFFRTLRPSDAVHPRYLFWRLHHLYEDPAIWRFQQQTTSIINLKRSDYLAHEIYWPPLPDQRQIAEILDTVDQAIRHTEAVIAKLGQVKEGLLRDLLTRGLDENSDLRDPERHPEQFNDSSLGRIPTAWEVRALGSLADYLNGYAFKPEDWSDSGLPIIRIAQMRDEVADVDRYPGTVEPRYLIDDGDLLFSWSATLMVMIWDRGPAIVNQHIFRVDPRAGVDKGFLYFLLGFRMEELAAQSHGTTMRHIKKRDLLPHQVPVPPIREQQRIAKVLTAHEKRIHAEEVGRHKLLQLKDGLMQDLLTGRVRVPDDSAVPAPT